MKKLTGFLCLCAIIVTFSACSDDDTLLEIAGSNDLNLTIKNSSGLPDDSVFFVITGMNKDHKWCHLDTTGTLIPVSTADNTHDGYANYSYCLKNVKKIKMSYIESGKVIFSIGKPVYLEVSSSNTILEFFDIQAHPNYACICDKIELTFTGQPYLNTSIADYFGMPFILKTKIGNDSVKLGIKGTRKAIFDFIINNASDDFKDLIVGSETKHYRILNPVKSASFSTSYYDTYTDLVWNKYKTDSLTMSGTVPTNWTATGKVNGEDIFHFVFKTGFPNDTVCIRKPFSSNIFGCDGRLFTTGSQPVYRQKLVAMFGAALNRSIIHEYGTITPCDTSKFYKHSVTNWFSKAMHMNSINGLCYGFPYDDVCDQSTTLSNASIRDVVIEIGKFE